MQVQEKLEKMERTGWGKVWCWWGVASDAKCVGMEGGLHRRPDCHNDAESELVEHRQRNILETQAMISTLMKEVGLWRLSQKNPATLIMQNLVLSVSSVVPRQLLHHFHGPHCSLRQSDITRLILRVKGKKCYSGSPINVRELVHRPFPNHITDSVPKDLQSVPNLCPHTSETDRLSFCTTRSWLVGCP